MSQTGVMDVHAPLPPSLLLPADAVSRHIVGRMPLGSVGRLGVAFSGGVDSGLLLALAVRTLGAERVLAVIGVSPSLARDELNGARDVAAAIGAPVVEVATHEGDHPMYRANGPDRCFFCKDELFTRISDEVAGRHGATAAQVALAWVIRGGGVCAIPQAGTPAHVQENRAALDLRLAGEDLVALDRGFPPPTEPRPLEVI